MPDRTFGRTIRSRRTKLGLSQAKLGELVGRSASTIRSWERDKTHPTDTGVIVALAAILGADEQQLFERAGQAVPNLEDSPTVEQALATLRPEPEFEFPEIVEERPSFEEVEADEDPTDLRRGIANERLEGEGELTGEIDVDSSEVEDVATEFAPDAQLKSFDSEDLSATAELEQEVLVDPSSAKAEEVVAPTYTAPAVPPVIVTPNTSSSGSSYLEDRSQRQLYLVRNLATIVVLVGLVVALLWALSESMTAIGDWWDEFSGNLRP